MSSQPPIRRRAVWDIVLSIVMLAVALIGAVVALLGQVFILAFTDYCPPATCDIEQGVNSVGTVWSIVGVIFIACVAVTIVFLVRRRRAWWVALIGLVAVIAGAIVAFSLYISAVS